MTMLGTGLLWFGWFGFNGGSALAANEVAATAFVATHLGGMAGMAMWTVMEWLNRQAHHPGRGLRRHCRPGHHYPGRRFCRPQRAIIIGLPGRGLLLSGGHLQNQPRL